MCEFISWIEKEGRLYYLTDEQTYSVDGIYRLQGTKDNDIIGHSAIRRFFDIPACSAFCGRSCARCGAEGESKYFWQDEHLPAELRDKLKDVKVLDATWGRMLRASLQPDDISRLLEGPEPLGRYAWELSADLWDPDRHIAFLETYLQDVQSVSPRIRDAFVRLDTLKAPLATYVYVVDRAVLPDVRRRALAKLRRYPRGHVVRELTECLLDSWNADLLRMLLTLDLSATQLRVIWSGVQYSDMGAREKKCPELNRLARMVVADPKTTRESLSQIVTDGDLSYQVNWAAWRKLVRRVPTTWQLVDVADCGPSERLRHMAERELERRGH